LFPCIKHRTGEIKKQAGILYEYGGKTQTMALPEMSSVLLKIIVLSSREDVFHEFFFYVFFDLLLAVQRAEGKPDALTILVR
jgi:hypothetical protein